ncbi:alpha/beta hydrolase [Calidifontibacter sp. DB0510]|uniref:Alpha/beta hydrolase n=1 Tax=Metallococcus carri TaxID=1656884 RepID=A0A967B2I9_9MICO|nr:alpha/beta hydrolase [Metallococcus carri]NHN57113.1 alpha/beta hydrolase [Metallococcus carri]NOP39018.1 alpha/beta hydrolase [Calidifontibacter sp. DB2511S]
MPDPIRRTVRTSDGARLATFVREGEGPTIVLAHGWTNSHQVWHRVLDALGPDARVVTYDQRGHGRSTLAGGTHRSRGESIKRLGRDLAEVIAATAPEGRLVLGGHSMGGMTVMAYAGLAGPEALARIDRVSLIGTAAGELRGAGLPAEAQIMRAMSLLPTRTKLGRLVSTKRTRSYTFGEDPREEDVRLARQLSARTTMVTYGSFYGALMQHDEREALQHLAPIPTTILVGELDKLTPKGLARRMAERMPEAHLEIVPRAGHMLPLERPELVAATLTDPAKRQ